ncbi:MAG: glucose-6-phosphate isomerase, partial [Acidobacteria bacterium]|nr:glucose-6-phosphate isomerase [Acidobacteriota bacterium]
DQQGNTSFEPMTPGSLHYVPGHVAHRVANTGSERLVFTACWPSDAGTDYTPIREHGFSARLRAIGGRPELVKR